MVYGQIDPARLRGDALTNWYLRSPTDMEAERQAAAAQRYDNFFGNAGQLSDEDDSASADRYSPDSDGAKLGQDGPGAGYSGGLDDGVYRPGRDDAQMTPAAATAWNCPTCHGRLPLPPQLQPLQPLFRDIPPSWGGQAPEPRREKYPQCEMQDRQDRGICAQQPTEPAKAVCNASATDRRVWCEENQGELGFPRLNTAWRRNGRRWP